MEINSSTQIVEIRAHYRWPAPGAAGVAAPALRKQYHHNRAFDSMDALEVQVLKGLSQLPLRFCSPRNSVLKSEHSGCNPRLGLPTLKATQPPCKEVGAR
jgi:hypothetical protein